jgi:ankyrin repeat protein
MMISMWTNSAAAGINDVLIKAAEQGNINVVKFIIDDGANVNARKDDGMTSLMYASLGGHLEIVRALIARGADVNARTNDGVSSLMYASLGGHLEIVRALLAKGADVNAGTNDGRTALMVASVGGRLEVVNALLSKGADVHAETRDRETALLMASIKGHRRVEEVLREAGTQVSPRPAKSVEAALQPVPGVPSRGSVSLLSGPEKVITDRVAPIPNAILAVAKPAAMARAIVSEPAQTDAALSTPRAPAAEAKELEQKRVVYTLLAGETVKRSKVGILLKKLKASGLQPVVREENKNKDVYRLVTECFNAGNAAQKHLTRLARKEKQAFVVHDGEQFCVAAASFFSYDAALTEQNRLAKKDLKSEIVKAQIPLTAWQVTVGRFNDSQSAAAELKRLEGRDINVVMIPWDK